MHDKQTTARQEFYYEIGSYLPIIFQDKYIGWLFYVNILETVINIHS